MLIGSCIVNPNGNFGYTVSSPFQHGESLEWFVKVIWVDSLIDAAERTEEYPSPLQVSYERQSDIRPQ